MNEAGQRYPDSWTYYKCDRCNVRLKIFHGGKIEDPTEADWTQHCSEKEFT